jgi:hypothetical protein
MIAILIVFYYNNVSMLHNAFRCFDVSPDVLMLHFHCIFKLKMMQEASKRRCNKIKLISLSFFSKLNFTLFITIKAVRNSCVLTM